MKKNFLGFLLLLLFVSPCVTIQNLYANNKIKQTSSVASPAPAQQEYVVEESFFTYAESTGRNLEPSTSAINLPLVAEVQVIPKKIEYTEVEAFKNVTVTEAIRMYGERFKSEGIAEYKRIALANAANANNADIVVGATFIVKTTNDNHFSITVVGYPAVYKNFHTATKADAELLKLMEPFSQKTHYDPILNTKTAPIVTTSTIVSD